MAIVDVRVNRHSHAASHYGAPPAHAERPRRHPWEIGLLVLVIVFSVVLYLIAAAEVLSGTVDVIWLSILATPVVLYLGRGLLYGRQRVNGVKMSPTQFPDGYALVVEAARRFGGSAVRPQRGTGRICRSGQRRHQRRGQRARLPPVRGGQQRPVRDRRPYTGSRSAGVRHWPRGWSHRGGPRIVLAPGGSAGDADPVPS